MARYNQKIEKLKRFTDQTIQEITQNKQEYKKFLDFQARLYKYRFEDALLIYAQNPNAQACATYDQWNSEKVGRKIYRNPNTIHVFDGDSQSQIKYLFELSDTHGKPFRFPTKITIPEPYQQAVLQAFGTNAASDNFHKNFKWCVENYVQQNYDTFVKEIQSTYKGGFTPALLNENEYKQLVIDSVGYMMCQRFSIPKGIYDNEELAFNHLEKVRQSKEAVMLLGCAAQQLSQRTTQKINQVLVEEKRLKNERKQQSQQGIDHSREIRVQTADLRGSESLEKTNGGTETDQGRKIRQDVGNLHGTGASSQESLSTDGRPIAGNDETSTRGSHGNADQSTGAIPEEEPQANEELPGDGELRQPDDDVGRGSHDTGDRVPDTLTDSQINMVLQSTGEPHVNIVSTNNNKIIEKTGILLKYDDFAKYISAVQQNHKAFIDSFEKMYGHKLFFDAELYFLDNQNNVVKNRFKYNLDDADGYIHN